MIQFLNYYFSGMLPYLLAVTPLVLLFRFGRQVPLKRLSMKTTVLHETGVLLFCLYCVAVLSQTVLPRLEITREGLHVLATAQVSSLNLTPFHVFRIACESIRYEHDFSFLFYYLIGNIVVFLPLGYFLPLLWRKMDSKKTVLIAFLSSLAIELIQIPLPRETDIDDVLLNTLGGWLGYLIFAGMLRQVPAFVERCRVKTAAAVKKKGDNKAL